MFLACLRDSRGERELVKKPGRLRFAPMRSTQCAGIWRQSLPWPCRMRCGYIANNKAQ